MESSLYQEHKRTHPERFRVGRIRKTYVDAQGRSRDHPCFECGVTDDHIRLCIKCGKSGLKDTVKQTTLGF